MAVFSDGRKEFVVKKGSVKKTDFVAFIESLSLCNNSVVIMDNASIHKKLVLSHPVNICYTPPYSPEFNAIELCFAKVKRDFRRLNYIPNETKTHVSDMISLAFGNLTDKIIMGCFEHVWNTYVYKAVCDVLIMKDGDETSDSREIEGATEIG